MYLCLSVARPLIVVCRFSGLQASVMSEMVVELLGVGLSQALEEPRPVVERRGQEFNTYG